MNNFVNYLLIIFCLIASGKNLFEHKIDWAILFFIFVPINIFILCYNNRKKK
jgi:hypothetical protein